VERGRYPERRVSDEFEALIRLEPKPWKPTGEFAQSDREFDPRELLADAGMNAVTKRQMAPRIGPLHVKARRLDEDGFIAIGRPEQQQNIGILRHVNAADFGIPERAPPPGND
jgi:hypothetical protein